MLTRVAGAVAKEKTREHAHNPSDNTNTENTLREREHTKRMPIRDGGKTSRLATERRHQPSAGRLKAHLVMTFDYNVLQLYPQNFDP